MIKGYTFSGQNEVTLFYFDVMLLSIEIKTQAINNKQLHSNALLPLR